jgi:hypothetical protein
MAALARFVSMAWENLEGEAMTLILDDISLTFRDVGKHDLAAKNLVANEIPLIPVSRVKSLNGATHRIAERHL